MFELLIIVALAAAYYYYYYVRVVPVAQESFNIAPMRNQIAAAASAARIQTAISINNVARKLGGQSAADESTEEYSTNYAAGTFDQFKENFSNETDIGAVSTSN